MKNISLSILLLLIGLIGLAQEKRMVGVITDSFYKTKVSYASITNINGGKTVISDENGIFRLNIEEGNLISIASINHYTDTIYLTSTIIKKDTAYFFLKPISKNLKDVTVVSNVNRYQYDSASRRRLFLQDVGGNKIPLVSNANSGAGVGISLDRFSKREKNKRKAYEIFDMLEKEHYINYRFSFQTVIKYTGLTGEKLIEFMTKYRPNYNWLRKNLTEEDIKYYINDKLKEYN